MSMTEYVRKAKWMHVVIPLVALALYCVLFSLFLSWLVPEYHANVNAGFVNGVWKYSLLAAGLYLIFYVVYPILLRLILVPEDKERKSPSKQKKVKKPAFKNRIEKFDFILLLLPLTPIVQYILNNQDILSASGSLYVFAVFLGFSVLFIIVMPTLLGITGSTKTLMILGLAFTFTIINMASVSSGLHWFELGDLFMQLLVLSAVFVGGWVLYNLVGRRFLYVLVAVYFIANSAMQLASQGGTVTELPSANNELVELVGSRKPLSTPNIYLLVYDAYVANETMLGYGIDNSAQEEYLEALGFEMYPHTYSVAAESNNTMSRTLNASTKLYGSLSRGTSGDGIVQNLLRSFGYETYGVFWSNFFFRGIGSSYDFSFPEASTSPEASSSHDLLVKAISMGEFRFDVGFNDVPDDEFLEYKAAVFENVPDKPRFVYMHTLVPGHAQTSGKCLPNETALFKGRLDWANIEMKRDTATITQKDPGAIIIVAGDHGVHLTKTCTANVPHGYGISDISRLDIQDRFGTFLAIKWPTEDFAEYDDITVHQDIFPAVFAYLFGDSSLLEAKVRPTTLFRQYLRGAWVEDGIIHGGINDGEPLFVGQ